MSSGESGDDFVVKVQKLTEEKHRLLAEIKERESELKRVESKLKKLITPSGNPGFSSSKHDAVAINPFW